MTKQSFLDKMIQFISHKLPKAPANLQKYDVVIIGSNLGGFLTKNISKIDHAHHHVFVAHDQVSHKLNMVRPLQEYDIVSAKDMTSTTNEVFCNSVQNENKKVKAIVPEENKIIFENGKELQYGQLVLATGIREDWDRINGFKEALQDPDCPVFTSNYFPSDKNEVLGGSALFETGDAYFYIPKFPFSGEVETFNFLFNIEMWNMQESQGLVSPKRKVRIINANSRFSQNSDALDQFFKKTLEELGVEVMYETELESIDKKSKTMELLSKSGNKKNVEFQHLYVHLPAKQNELYNGLGISDDGIQVNVNSKLQTKYENIFATGDCVKNQGQRSFFSGLAQNNVVRFNVLEQLKGNQAIAEYDGYSKLYIPQAYKKCALYQAENKGELKEKIDEKSQYYMKKYLKYAKGDFKKLVKGKKFGDHDNTKQYKATKAHSQKATNH